MGVIKLGILGGFSGKVGSVVGCIVNGEAVIKALPTEKGRSSTAQQEAQRKRLITICKFLKPLLPYIQASFQHDAVFQSEYNAAFAANIKNAILTDGDNPKIDYTRAIVAHGSLPPEVHSVNAAVSDGLVEITWTNNSIVEQADDDDIILPLLYNMAKAETVFDLDTFRRIDERLTLQTPPHWAGDSFAIYFAISKASRKRVSNSFYLGTFRAS